MTNPRSLLTANELTNRYIIQRKKQQQLNPTRVYRLAVELTCLNICPLFERQTVVFVLHVDLRKNKSHKLATSAKLVVVKLVLRRRHLETDVVRELTGQQSEGKLQAQYIADRMTEMGSHASSLAQSPRTRPSCLSCATCRFAFGVPLIRLV